MKKIVLPILICAALFMSGCSTSIQSFNAKTQNKTFSNQIVSEINDAESETKQPILTELNTSISKFTEGKPVNITFTFNQLSEYPTENIVAKAKVRPGVKYLNAFGYDNMDKSNANALWVFYDVKRNPGTITLQINGKLDSNVEFTFYESDAKTLLGDVNAKPLVYDLSAKDLSNSK